MDDRIDPLASPSRPRRSKCLASATLVIAMVAAIGAGVATRDSLIAGWKIFRLSSDDARVVSRAASWLLDHRVHRAMPEIFARCVEVAEFDVGPLLLDTVSRAFFDSAADGGRGLGEPDVVDAAVLGWHRLGVEGAQWLANRLMTGREDERRMAIVLLSTLGDASAPAVPALLECLRRDANPDIRSESMGALAAIGPSAAAAIPYLTALRDGTEGPSPLSIDLVESAIEKIRADYD